MIKLRRKSWGMVHAALRNALIVLALLACGCYGAKSDMWDPEPIFQGDSAPDAAEDTAVDRDVVPDPMPEPDVEIDMIDIPDLPDLIDIIDIPPDTDINLCELPCDDGIACTEDRCEPSIGCIFTPRDEWCDDAIHCTIDRCDTAMGCVNTPQDSLCSDGIDCTLDRCDLSIGACTSTPRDWMCSDIFDCTVDRCDPYGGCVSWPDDSRCAPGERCDPACNGCILDVAPVGKFLAHSSSALYQIDPAAPSSTYIGDIGYSVTDIAVTDDNMLWGITFSSLLAIDFCTGVGSLVGDVGSTSSLNALVSAPSGMFFGADYNGDVWRIDPATGAGTRIGSYGPGLYSSGDLAYGPDNLLYGTARASWTSNDLLISVDPSSGSAGIVGNIGFAYVYGLAVLSDVLYGLTDYGEIITINRSTGRGSLVGVAGSSYWGAASPPPRP